MKRTFNSFKAAIDATIQEIKKSQAKSRNVITLAANQTLQEIRSRHGRYPGDAKWAKLKPATIARKARGDSPLLETGKMRDSYGIKQDGNTTMVGSNYFLVPIHEFGTMEHPEMERPIIMPTAQKVKRIILPQLIEQHLSRI